MGIGCWVLGIGSFSTLADDGADFLLSLLVDPPDKRIQHVVRDLRHGKKGDEDDEDRSRCREIERSEHVRVLTPDEPVPNALLDVSEGKKGDDVYRNVFELEELQ